VEEKKHDRVASQQSANYLVIKDSC